MMHIALIVWHADETRGGAERYTFAAARELTKRGHTVTLLCGEAKTPSTDFRIEKLAALGLTRAGRYGDFCERWRSWRSAHEVDIAHAMLPLPGIDIYDAMAGFESLTLASEPFWKQPLLRKRKAFVAVERGMFDDDVTALVLSERERQSVRRIFSSRAEQVVTRPLTLVSAPALDRDQAAREVRAELKIHEPLRLVLFAGDDFERKNLRAAIEAIGPLTDVRLLVAGRGDASPFRSHRNVFFLGSRSDMPRLLAACDALVLPSWHEPFGMVVPEAMCQGCVPIVSANVGAADIIRAGVDGVIVDSPDDTLGIQRALEKLSDRTFLNQMSTAALSRREAFSLGRHFDTLEAIYASHLSGKER